MINFSEESEPLKKNESNECNARKGLRLKEFGYN